MSWPFSIRNLLYPYPREKYIWVKVRIIHETDKAILIKTNSMIWVPKIRIKRIRLRNNNFEIYIKESDIH